MGKEIDKWEGGKEIEKRNGEGIRDGEVDRGDEIEKWTGAGKEIERLDEVGKEIYKRNGARIRHREVELGRDKR